MNFTATEAGRIQGIAVLLAPFLPHIPLGDDIALGPVMLFGRYLPMVFVLALGPLADGLHG